MGAEVMAVPCDVTDQQQVETMVRTVLDRYGQIDVLINNAGYDPGWSVRGDDPRRL